MLILDFFERSNKTKFKKNVSNIFNHKIRYIFFTSSRISYRIARLLSIRPLPLVLFSYIYILGTLRSRVVTNSSQLLVSKVNRLAVVNLVPSSKLEVQAWCPRTGTWWAGPRVRARTSRCSSTGPARIRTRTRANGSGPIGSRPRECFRLLLLL